MFKNFLKYSLIFCSILINAQHPIRINELLSSNINGLVDEESGEFLDWIELYNSSDSLVDLSTYYLSENPIQGNYWQFPNNTTLDSNSYLIIWADGTNEGLHTNFKLNSDGEQLYLLNELFEVIDSVIYPEQKQDVSYGRVDTNSSVFQYYYEPTPAGPNITKSIQQLKISDLPAISISSGFYNSQISIEISSNKDGIIYYTTDGSFPTQSFGTIYNNQILVDSTTVLRVIQIEENELPSEVITNTYFINENIDLPVVSLTTDPSNLYDDEIGINTIGTNGVSYWNVKANYWQNWERPVNIEFFEDNKNSEFQINGGLAISGARRNMLQKSFRVFTRKKYGNEFLDYQLFPEYERRTFSSFVLRNGGYEDFISTLFRDGFIQTIISQNMDLECQAYRPSVLFINGRYHGIYNIREKQNEEYIQSKHGSDPDNLDILENDLEIVEGDDIHYKSMISFIEQNDLSIQSNYDSVKQLMDIDNFINYQIAQQYIANVDWPANNIKYWRPKTPFGKWRWMLFDVDAGFGLRGGYNFNSIEFAAAENSSDWNNLPWSTFLFRSLLKNEEFRNNFSQKFAASISYVFNSENVLTIVDSISGMIESEFSRHISRWSPNCSVSNPQSKDGCLFDDISEWYSNIEIVKHFAEQRPNIMFNYVKDFFGLGSTFNVTISSNYNQAGLIDVNGVNAKFDDVGRLFGGIETVIRVHPKTGYKFVGWEGDYNGNNEIIEIKLTDNLNIQANFEPVNQSTIPATITSDYELTVENSPYSSDGDIYIYENAKLIVEPGVEVLMPESASIYVFGRLNIQGDENNHVIIKSDDSDKKWGAINFVNATHKSVLSHVNISGTTRGKDQLTQIGGISSFNSDLEIDYLQMNNVDFPIYVEYGEFIMRNSTITTSVISDGVNVKYGSAIIENCEFIGGTSIDTDAIDYDGVERGIIRRNVIHDFWGDNNDGIDIGEEAKEILIEENLIYNCSDKGISVGQGSTVNIIGNTIIHCSLGIGIKDEGSYGLIDHTTFFENGVAVSGFEKSPGRGGGIADISNTIFSQSILSDILVDEFSEINVNYSLSDKALLDGTGNIIGEPDFINIDSMNFAVSNTSVAIDNGDPNFPLDPDGSRTDIGAQFSDYQNKDAVIITEINYHSADNFDTRDWIELYNPNEYSVDISKWTFKDDNNDHRFVLGEGVILEAQGFIILCEDTLQFNLLHPGITNVLGDFEFGLNNAGELLRLYDNRGNIIDSLTFDDKPPWPQEADGAGYTLQLTDHNLDNSIGNNWNSLILHGTPGKLNMVVGVNEKDEIPQKYSLRQNYPNPFNPSTQIGFLIPRRSNVKLTVYNVLGSKLFTLVDKELEAGRYEVSFDVNNSNNKLSSGIYFYRLHTDEFQQTKKMLLLK